MSLRFRSFGPCGPAMEIAWDQIAEITQQLWATRNSTSWLDEATKAIDPATIWFNAVISLTSLGYNRDGALAVWEKLRHSFRPAFPASPAMLNDPGLTKLRMGLIQTHISALFEIREGIASRKISDALCFGPFTEDQLGYITDGYTSVFEFAAGSGYLLAVLRERGLVVSGMDSNAYGMLGELKSYSPFAWTQNLRNVGLLHAGDENQFLDQADGKALILCFPAPSSSYPVAVLKRYRERGGQSLLLKLGGFSGRLAGAEGNAKNIASFFEELAEHWVAANSMPIFEAELMNNNLFAFQRRS